MENEKNLRVKVGVEEKEVRAVSCQRPPFLRIIPCLDVLHGRVVKGVRFVELRDAGSVTELAQKYSKELADELVLLDISASYERRATMLSWVEEVAKNINIPFTVGGGINSEKDAEALLKRGADKISINSAALENPDLINRLSAAFGKQSVVVAVDAQKESTGWQIYGRGGRYPAGRELLEWVTEAEQRGAGELLFTAIDCDGTGKGFACDITAEVSQRVSIPVIASGGAGSPEDFYEVFTRGKADAALAAGVFHFNEISVPELKAYLLDRKINVCM